MYTLLGTQALQAKASAAGVVNVTIFGDAVGTSDSYGVLVGPVTIGASVASLYSPGGTTAALVSKIELYNSDSVDRIVTLYINGAATANIIRIVTVPAGGTASYEKGANWAVYNASGLPVTSGVSSVANTDGTITASPTSGAVILARPAITGDVSVPGGSNVAALASVIVAGGPTGSGTAVPVITYDAKGRLTVVTTAATVGSVAATDTTLTAAGTATAPTLSRAAITGDISVPAGSNASTLASIITAAGPTGSSSVVPVITYDAKGRLTTVTTATITPTSIGAVASVAATDTTITITGTATNPTVARAAITGDVSVPSGSNAATLASVITAAGPVGSASVVPVITYDAKGRLTVVTTATVTPAAIGAAPTSRLINTTAPLTGGGDLTADRTLAISAATTAAAGSQSAIDKKKEDNLWFDVTANTVATLVGDDATLNDAAWTTLFAALPVGAVVYFPTGTYRFSADINITADKHLTIKGAGKYSSIIKTTSATANGFVISTGQYWYNQFEDLRFETTANKTAGAAILISTVGLGANKQQVGINVYRCSFSNWFKAIYCVADDVTQGPGNLSIWDSLDISIPGSTGSTNSRGIHINGAGTNAVCSNSTINMGFPPFQVAGTACIEINASGAIQFTNGEFIGGTNTLLLNASSGGTTSVAAVFATNCFFDQSASSTVKITGANVVNRCKFVECGITTGNTGATGAIAFEIASTGTGAAGTATAAADGIDLFDCDIYPNGVTGTTNGVQITGAQGVSITNCRISGFTNGVTVTPAVSNGYTKLFFKNNKMGATNNFTTPNTVGLNLAAGAFQYGVVAVADNDFTGSTTPIVDASTVTSSVNKSINSNIGLIGAAGALVATPATIGATETVIHSVPIPANALMIGTTIRIVAFGIMTATTPTVLAKLHLGTAGTTADAAVCATVATGVATGTGWMVEAFLTVRTIGSGGTVVGNAWVAGTAPGKSAQTATVAVNTTLANILTLSLTGGGTTPVITVVNAYSHVINQ